MKKIYWHAIKMGQSYNEGTGEPIYEVEAESSECEYSEEWTKDDDDPIKDYVENAIENNDEDFEDAGYSWDNQEGNINFSTFSCESYYHILFKNGVPIELYYVGEEENV